MASRPGAGMPSGWRLVSYITEQGRCVITEFLADLRRTNARAYVEFLEHWRPLFEAQGPFRIGPPHWEGLGGELYEIRWGRNRIYCSVERVRTVMMLLGRIKTWPKFTKEDRKVCEQRLADVRSRSYDQSQRQKAYEARQQRGKNGTL